MICIYREEIVVSDHHMDSVGGVDVMYGTVCFWYAGVASDLGNESDGFLNRVWARVGCLHFVYDGVDGDVNVDMLASLGETNELDTKRHWLRSV